MEDMNESKNVKKSVIKLNEEQLRKVVAESVKRVLNEISYGVARDAFKKAGENFNKDWSLFKNPRKMAQLKNLHQHFVDRSAENFNPEMPVLVCFDDHCENFKAEDLEQYFEVTGFVEPSPNPIYADQRMIGYPKLKGFIGPMWDGNKLRYETQKVYDMLST